MRDVHITVEVDDRRSDNNYGGDRAMCQIGATLDVDEGVDDSTDLLFDQANRAVERQLGRSLSLEVRRTMLRKPRLCNECKEPLSDEITGYLHPACDEVQRERYQRQREEQNARWEEERAMRALTGVGATTEADDEFARDAADDDEDSPL